MDAPKLHESPDMLLGLLDNPLDGNALRLKRTLGALDLTLIGIGASIGSGIFVLSGVALREAGPGVCLSFLVAAAVCMLDALCYAELASRFPTSGGAYLFTKQAFGNPAALVVGLNLLFDYHVGAAAIARSFAGYLGNLLETVPGVRASEVAWVEAVPVKGGSAFLSLNFVAPLLLLALTAVLCRGAKESASLNMVLTGTKVLTISVVVAVGATRVDTSLWSPAFPEGFSPVASQAATLFFAYVGFDAVANSAEECRRPGRDIPVAIVASLGVCALLYVAVAAVLSGLVKYSDVDESAPLAAAFDHQRGLKWARDLVDVGGVVGLSTTLLIGLYAQSRVYLGMARDGALPRWLAQVHPKYQSPMNAQLLCGLVAVMLASLFDVHLLASYLSIGVMTSYTVVAASTLSLRATNKPRAHKAMLAAALLSMATGLALRLGAPVGFVSAPLAALTLATLTPLVFCLSPTTSSFPTTSSSSSSSSLSPSLSPLLMPTSTSSSNLSSSSSSSSSSPPKPPSLHAMRPTAWNDWVRNLQAAYPPPQQPPPETPEENSSNSSSSSSSSSNNNSNDGSDLDGSGGVVVGGGVVFACPCVPFVPWLALCLNAGLMVQLPVQAWGRLAFVTLAVLVSHYRKHGAASLL